MMRIHPLGTGAFLPAFALGFELQDDSLLTGALPDWIVTVRQQAGGLLTTRITVVGAMLRLEANRDRAIQTPDHVIRGLRAMAEEPDLDVLGRDYPALAAMVSTHGVEYGSRELSFLERFIGSSFMTPRFNSGIEAFVRLDRCDPLQFFSGWKLLSVMRRGGLAHEGSVFDVDDSSLHEVEMRDDERLSASHMAVLERLGSTIGTGVLLPFLLWENSD